jgi:hypothetical protein
MILIKRAARLLIMIGQLERRFIEGNELGDLGGRRVVALHNALRLRLQAIGLERAEKSVPAVADFLTARRNRSFLVVEAPTATLNPLIDREVIAEALADDPEAASAEWLAEFRSDLADFVDRAVVEGCVEPGVYERPPAAGYRYVAFTDPSGGSSDSFTVAIAHQEGEGVVLDLVREVRPPFIPGAVVEEYAAALKSYGLSAVTGDEYGKQWVREQFLKCGIRYEGSDKNKSEIYLEALPLLNGGRLDLLDNQRLVSQICGLERRVARGGRESVDHAPMAHDDLANAALGAAVLCGAGGVRRCISMDFEDLFTPAVREPPEIFMSKATPTTKWWRATATPPAGSGIGPSSALGSTPRSPRRSPRRSGLIAGLAGS